MPEHQEVCCICGQPVEPPYNQVGHRVYCDAHFAALNKSHSGFWLAGLIQIIGVGVVSALIAFLARFLPPLSGASLIVVGLVLALLPTVVWLIFFYRQDRLEPEPKAQIAQVFLIALLLTDVFGVRMVNDWMRLSEWSTFDWTTSLLASVLVIGFTYQAITYFAVRTTVYTTPEFDERMDGIVYGTVAGLGIATLLNLRYILDNGGVALAPGIIRITTTTLALASFSGLFGYFMAQAKFEHKPVWWIPFGMAVAAILHGLFSWLINEVSAAGLVVNPWRSLGLGLVVALAVFGLLVMLMGRVTAITLRSSRGEQR